MSSSAVLLPIKKDGKNKPDWASMVDTETASVGGDPSRVMSDSDDSTKGFGATTVGSNDTRSSKSRSSACRSRRTKKKKLLKFQEA
jgi:hypothetical protein